MKKIINEYIKMTATEAVALLRSKEVSPLDLVEASIQRIEAVDNRVNALPIHCFEQARSQAKSFNYIAHSENPKSLCGLPIAIKDYNDLGGALTTYGSPIFSKNVVKKI
jgi:amidase